jgi:AcrR family transcriptional regulator
MVVMLKRSASSGYVYGVPPPVVKRADAVRNRERILATAEDMFARDGLSVSVDDIARRAKVGIGTLYRHFPTKDALVAAIVIDRIGRVAERAEALHDAPDPGAALLGLIEQMVAEGVNKRDFVDALGGSDWLDTPAADAIKQRFRRALAKLLAKAQTAGAIRADVMAPDLLALVRGVLAAGTDAKVRGRMLAVLLDGLRARSRS